MTKIKYIYSHNKPATIIIIHNLFLILKIQIDINNINLNKINFIKCIANTKKVIYKN